VLFSGLCGTDVHYFEYGQVLGHEGVGEVISVGSKVPADFKGQVFGWGIQLNVLFLFNESNGQAWGMCDLCLEGQEIYCPKRQIQSLHLTERGTFASHYLVNYRFLFRIPEGMDPAYVAPLMGAGATVFSALYNYDVRPSETVAVVGLGRVGHLGVSFLNSWGYRVILLSTSIQKKNDAINLGATDFVLATGDWTPPLFDTVDTLLMVANIKPDKWDQYISILKPRGKIILVTAGTDVLGIPVSPSLPLIYLIYSTHQ